MPNSFPGWTSCTTGCNEGKHGIFMPLVRRADNFSMKAMDSTDIRVKTVWEILSERGHRSVVINDPCSFPPQRIDGWVVAGMTTPESSAAWTHPPELKAEILARFPDYVVDVNLFGKSRAQILEQLVISAQQRLEVSLYLMASREWDLFWVTFTEPDRVQHRFWADQQTDHPHHRPEFPSAVDDMYRQMDASVARLIDAAPEATQVFLVSDHGFAPFYCQFDMTGWLIARGYTVQLGGRAGLKRTLARVGLLDTATAAYRRLQRLRQREARHGIELMRESAESSSSQYSTTDWSKTRAYATLDGGVRINVRGREPHGIVERAEASELIARLQRELAEQTFPNCERVFDGVYRAEEVFTGPATGWGPDLVVPVRQDAYRGPVRGHRFLNDRHRNSGEHSRFGVFVAWGPGIEAGARVVTPSLIDIAPTVLYSLGEPPTEEMDGRVLGEVFAPDVRDPALETPVGSSMRDFNPDHGFTDEEEALVEERLRGLGYIE
jgi:predicted AlkP superfamily phosphohydrolase/phosphomutase